MTMHPNGTESAVATDHSTLLRCGLPACGKPLSGLQTKYCSPKHKSADYDRLHPRLPLHEASGYLAPRPLPEDPEGRRDVGKAVAGSNNKHQRAIARWAALMCFGDDLRESVATRILRDEGVIRARASIVSDVRRWCAVHNHELEWAKPWTGSLFQCEWFEATGTLRSAYHQGSNARKCFEWQLTAEGRAAYRAARELMG